MSFSNTLSALFKWWIIFFSSSKTSKQAPRILPLFKPAKMACVSDGSPGCIDKNMFLFHPVSEGSIIIMPGFFDKWHMK
jgi:hypothetical protein